MAKKLQLSKETIRSLSEESLAEVAGGAEPTENNTITWRCTLSAGTCTIVESLGCA